MPQDAGRRHRCPANMALEDAYFFMHEGLPMVYSDGFNHNAGGGTPIVSYANITWASSATTRMPDTMYLHNQLARGGTWSALERSKPGDVRALRLSRRHQYRAADAGRGAIRHE